MITDSENITLFIKIVSYFLVQKNEPTDSYKVYSGNDDGLYLYKISFPESYLLECIAIACSHSCGKNLYSLFLWIFTYRLYYGIRTTLPIFLRSSI